MGNPHVFWFAALLCAACNNPAPRSPTPIAAAKRDAGTDAAIERPADASTKPDAKAAQPDASVQADAEHDAGVEVGGGNATGGSGGSQSQPIAGSGGNAEVSGQGGTEAPTGGSPAPADYVLWSQAWTVAIHSAVNHPGVPNAKMGLLIDSGEGCRFWETVPADSGSTQTLTTDAKCIAESLAIGRAVIFDGNVGKGTAGAMPLAGWNAAVSGHTVTALRRTVTYTISVQGADTQSFNYADLSALLEAIGH